MTVFVGRRKELQILESCTGKGQAALIYGRKRIGKTALIDRYCEGKRSLRITCLDSTLAMNLSYISEILSAVTGKETEYRTLLELTHALEELSRSDLVIAIDEYQYLNRCSKGASDSFLQHLLDGPFKRTGSTLILCGSAVSVMRSTGEDGGRPLYGRFAATVHLGPLSFEECAELHPGMERDDAMRLYLSVGGVPKYHILPDVRTYQDFLRRECVETDSLVSEVSLLMKADYPDSGRYEAVVMAICRGKTSLKTIAEAVDLEPPQCLKVLRDLEANGAVEKVNPMLGAPKRGVYLVRDDLLAFRYGILTRYGPLFGNADADTVSIAAEPLLRTFFGNRFELFCRDYLVRSYPVIECGRWWSDDPVRDVHEEIDIVARLAVGNSKVDLFAECKFRRSECGIDVYRTLQQRASRFDRTSNPRLMIMSWSGFDEDLVELAEGTDLLLVGLEELAGDKAPPRIHL